MSTFSVVLMTVMVCMAVFSLALPLERKWYKKRLKEATIQVVAEYEIKMLKSTEEVLKEVDEKIQETRNHMDQRYKQVAQEVRAELARIVSHAAWIAAQRDALTEVLWKTKAKGTFKEWFYNHEDSTTGEITIRITEDIVSVTSPGKEDFVVHF